MKKPSTHVLLFLSVIVATLLLFGGFHIVQSIPESYRYDYPLSDEEYISITNRTQEAQAFHEKYPSASTFVDRSGRLAVDYRVATDDGHMRLRVFIDPKHNEPSEMFLDMNGT